MLSFIFSGGECRERQMWELILAIVTRAIAGVGAFMLFHSAHQRFRFLAAHIASRSDETVRAEKRHGTDAHRKKRMLFLFLCS